MTNAAQAATLAEIASRQVHHIGRHGVTVTADRTASAPGLGGPNRAGAALPQRVVLRLPGVLSTALTLGRLQRS
jgi:hypothetical protein